MMLIMMVMKRIIIDLLLGHEQKHELNDEEEELHDHQLPLQVNTTTPAGLTPLMLACLREDVAVVKNITIDKSIIRHTS